ncbi:transcriptional regulator, TetR family [Atopostipes suicloacalis DSM 15692]|uniref:Transcriptional regulator, TetR family n=1 Tax=Atopostipes suicloacalis DSM 15692 TaxID=1121025 RepID=A0A1M4VPB5_9LACT|nr:TetR/AcrR family transcriptional regulator [Atopostipes suicloacalis]SHE70809.1 transcriptional regulator, TetR family [Atopostipes suicloacalis DSM 15692]
MSEEEKIDRRIRKSKEAIRTALVKLLTHKNLENITITEIAKEADINRKTFYNNYENIFQVIEEIENDIVNSFNDVLSKINLEENLKQPLDFFETLTNIIQNDFEFYSDLVQTQKVGEINLIAKITETLKERVKANLPKGLFQDKFTMEFSVNYIITGMMEGYKEWLQNPKEISLEKLAQTMNTLIFSGLNGILANET